MEGRVRCMEFSTKMSTIFIKPFHKSYQTWPFWKKTNHKLFVTAQLNLNSRIFEVQAPRAAGGLPSVPSTFNLLQPIVLFLPPII